MLIYLFKKKNLPKKDKIIEKVIYHDKEGVKWEVCRYEKAMYLICRKKLDSNDMPQFRIKTHRGSIYHLKNTGIFYLEMEKDDDYFDVFSVIRELIKENNTFEIWRNIHFMIQYRFDKSHERIYWHGDL
jgi:hypothetical protein